MIQCFSNRRVEIAPDGHAAKRRSCTTTINFPLKPQAKDTDLLIFTNIDKYTSYIHFVPALNFARLVSSNLTNP
jgi:hypothetical protein